MKQPSDWTQVEMSLNEAGIELLSDQDFSLLFCVPISTESMWIFLTVSSATSVESFLLQEFIIKKKKNKK